MPGTARPIARPVAPAAEPTGESLVRTALKADVAAVTPGSTFHLLLEFTIEPGWHIYWRNAGDSGGPPTVRLQMPEGFTAGPIEWPAPTVFESGETTFGYSGTTTIFIPITTPSELPATASGGFEISADLRWMVCKERCFLGRRSERLSLPGGTSPNPVRSDALEKARRRLPRPASEVGVTAAVEGDVLVVAGPAPDGARVAFFPLGFPGVEFQRTFPEPVVARDGRFLLRLPFVATLGNALGQPLRVGGAVLVGEADAPVLYTEIELPLDL
jgi:thiol:disulfide interchange protein DsbD